MKRDLRSMGKNQNMNRRPVNNQQSQRPQNQKPKQPSEQNGSKEEDVRKKAEEFSKLSEGELYSELFKNVDEAKKSGNLSSNDLDNFLKTVAPMLNKEQMDKMNDLINKIK